MCHLARLAAVLGMTLLSITLLIPHPASADSGSRPVAGLPPPAAALINAFVVRHMEALGTPGLTLALTDSEGLVHEFHYGYSNLETGEPVTAQTLFPIGSISKALTALLALQFSGEKRIDIDSSIGDHLPWLDPPSSLSRITVQHLLSHTSGLPTDRDDIPSSPYRVLAARDLPTTTPPGERFHYSNVGYQLLGYLLEEVGGRPFAELLRERVFEPVGMHASEPAITHQARARIAVGYVSKYSDRPPQPSDPLVPAPWFEYGDADGGIAATGRDLAVFLGMLLNHGITPDGGRIVDEQSFRMMTTCATPPRGPSCHGLGLEIGAQGTIGHYGAMIGHSAQMLGDLPNGIGAVVMLNGPGDPTAVAAFALEVLRASRARDPLPRLPRIDPTRVPHAAQYAGRYRSPDGDGFDLVARGGRLYLVQGNRSVRLQRRGEDRFLAPIPRFEQFLLGFERSAGTVTHATHGAQWYVTARYPGPWEFDLPEDWLAYPGRYQSWSPWIPERRVIHRRGQLLLIQPSGREQRLEPLEHTGWFRVPEAQGGETVHFRDVVDGRALRVNVDGVDLYRSALR
ncbi:beta-lactamase [Thioalkalivibrio nitratireducens DSM 14787]|uniref:Beta-lactamase n=1 Tax=Thioalkalivibrio nitratireducens (strain DSM 14787 / UNIQEM 213 / ALEN2) TaxID=1255043 RepID=L0DZX1_THIND|nr:serine hydrolase domain-containing protein [Thioalkalivibrio nitratireducens]AGA34505.1 beta-lactamase [Thioalkalivibrio nitratireducens DSM 14787]